MCFVELASFSELSTMNTCMIILVVVAVAGVCEAVEKRSDDTSPLEAVVARLTSDLQALEAKVTALTHNTGGYSISFSCVN